MIENDKKFEFNSFDRDTVEYISQNDLIVNLLKRGYGKEVERKELMMFVEYLFSEKFQKRVLEKG